MAQIDIVLSGLDAEIVALVAGKVDLGTTNAQGTCRIVDGGGTMLVDIPLSNPAFAAGTPPAYDAAGVPLSAVAGNTGTAAECRILDRDENIVWEGSATLIGGGGFAELDKVAIVAGDTVTLQSMSLTFPA